eukprot:294453_1
MAEKKENEPNFNNKNMNDAVYHTLLSNVIAKRWPYTPQSRLKKWASKLGIEDLDYLIDLIRIPQQALTTQNHKFTTNLYGTLLDIKLNLSILEIQILSKTEGAIPIQKIEGYY